MHNKFVTYLDNLPIKKKLFLVFAIALGSIAGSTAWSAVVLNTLSGIRASIAFQNIWVESYNESIFHLRSLTINQRESTHQAYKDARGIINNFGIANQQFNSASPDKEIVLKAWQACGLRTSDINQVYFLITRFGDLLHIDEAVDAWSSGQKNMLLFDKIADQLMTDQVDIDRQQILEDINRKKKETDVYKQKFVEELGKSAALAETVFLWISLLFGLLAFVVTYFLIVYLNKHILGALGKIIRASEVTASGDFSVEIENHSQDELGQLTQTFNSMVKDLRTLDELKIRTTESARLASLGEISGGIAHEINNPLAIIRGNAEILEKYLHKDQLTSDIVIKKTTAILNTVNRIQRIVNSLLIYGRDGSEDAKEWVGAAMIIQDAVDLCGENFNSNGIKIEIEKPDEEVEIYCHRSQINQVMLNLLNNAKDAVMQCEKRVVRIRTTVQNNAFSLSVTDTGPGIAAALHEKIFQPFFTTKDVGSGTGLGLSLSKGLVEAQGATLEFDHEQPQTTFVVRFKRFRT